MKTNLLNLGLCLLLTISGCYAQKAKKVKMKIQCNEPDAVITINGQPAGNGSAIFKVLPDQTVKITAIKEGMFQQTIEYLNNGLTQIPKFLQLKLEKDAAFEASVQTDIANVDINLVPKKGQAEAWKSINSVIAQYFDAIEVSDKDNYYLRTAWVVDSKFNSGIIRTRVIVKANGSDNYSLKVVSEKSLDKKASAKDDEKFEPWNRVIRKYANLVAEIQNRL